MKIVTIVPLFVLLSSLNAAYAVSPDETIDSVKARRLLIAAEQRALDSGFIREEADCYERFVVNSCLDKIGVRKRAASAKLKEQENLLNDLERKDRGALQIDTTNAKASPNKLQADIDREMRSSAEYQRRAAQQKERDQQRHNVAPNKRIEANASEKKLVDQQRKLQVRSELNANASEKAKQFEERQNALLQRRVQHEAELKKRNTSSAKPLPLPE